MELNKVRLNTHLRNTHLKQFLPEVFFIEFSELSEIFAISKALNITTASAMQLIYSMCVV